MTTMNATDKQLELGFNGIQARPVGRAKAASPARNGGSTKCASRWKARWTGSAAAEPRPEQIWMPGTNREVKV